LNQSIDIKIFDIILIVFSGVVVLTATALLLIFLFIRNKKSKEIHLNEKLFLQTKFQQELLQTQIEIQEQTLKNISQEIHDNIGQVLIMAKLNLNTMVVNQTNEAKITSTKDLVAKAIGDLRNLSRSLLGEKITEIGLIAAIENELKVLEISGQFKTTLYIEGDVFHLDAQREIILFRIVQEAVNNAVKHANASQISIDLKYSASSFALLIADNGKGFEMNQLKSLETGIGLKNMRNRTELVGGRFTIESTSDRGTTVQVHIPRN
jgi:two-component system, NarL family, sensor kinase